MAKNTWFQEGTYYAKNREKLLAEGKARHLAKREREVIRPKPENCEICGKRGKITFDHGHQTGVFRGWLCYGCNIALGKIERCGVEKLVAYLAQGK